MRSAWRACWPPPSKPENPDLVLTGLQSEDLGLGQTGVIVAELLGLPHATLILHVEKTDAGLKVKRELEEGWFQTIELPTPAVLTIQSGGNKLRYATLMGIKRAKTKEVRRLTAAELGVDCRARRACWSRSRCRRKQKSTQILAGTAKEAAAALVEKLKSRRASYERHSGRHGRARRAASARISWEALAAGHAARPAQQRDCRGRHRRRNRGAGRRSRRQSALGRVVRVEHPLLAQYTADGFSSP